MTIITAETVLGQITAISQTRRMAWDFAEGTHGVFYSELEDAFGLQLRRGDDLSIYQPLTEAVAALIADGRIVEGAVAGACAVFAPAGTTLPQEW